MAGKKGAPKASDDDAPAGTVLLRRTWSELLEEPTKLLALGYAWLLAAGLAHLFGSGIAFNLNVIDLADPSDFLIAGLRDPFATVLALVSGAALVWMVARVRTKEASAKWLAPAALSLLVAATILSGLYRYGVTRGGMRGWPGTPLPMCVRVSGSDVPIAHLRIGVAMSGFLVFADERGRTRVLSRDSIEQITFEDRDDPEHPCRLLDAAH